MDCIYTIIAVVISMFMIVSCLYAIFFRIHKMEDFEQSTSEETVSEETVSEETTPTQVINIEGDYNTININTRDTTTETISVPTAATPESPYFNQYTVQCLALILLVCYLLVRLILRYKED